MNNKGARQRNFFFFINLHLKINTWSISKKKKKQTLGAVINDRPVSLEFRTALYSQC